MVGEHRQSPLWDESQGQSQPPMQLLGCAYGVAHLHSSWNCEVETSCGLYSRFQHEVLNYEQRAGPSSPRWCGACVLHWNGAKPWVASNESEKIKHGSTKERTDAHHEWLQAARLLDVRQPNCAALGNLGGMVAAAETNMQRLDELYAKQEGELHELFMASNSSTLQLEVLGIRNRTAWRLAKMLEAQRRQREAALLASRRANVSAERAQRRAQWSAAKTAAKKQWADAKSQRHANASAARARQGVGRQHAPKPPKNAREGSAPHDAASRT
mmetsp:Transcript_44880/g.104839  ORF Transcript_44880/g.104839 Transcript_44880/m.104839 type:complete len:271 (-) Transcript_44880:97-909(-)